MAGGIGSRFWPLSRKTMPKQFLDILGPEEPFCNKLSTDFQRSFPKRISMS
ncbi:MAG TPA: sugar phosphate nucleotidyltransferase [Prolixibacteraceae bacterium]|nr:sugar phosphate nucleotidyltransferase [Prolixibacteraceae bacterium]